LARRLNIRLSIGASILALGLLAFRSEFGDRMDRNLAIFNAISGPPDSFDPLNFDSANNVFIGRLLYSTPIEFDDNGMLTSEILDSFDYDSNTRTVTFLLKHGIKYEDGSELSVEDLAMAIKRMAYTRPKFPVLEKIVGLSAWIQQKFPLAGMPHGIKINGREVKIALSEDLEHPLFRFSLELFAIVPSKCIDLETGKLTCVQPPESGRYRRAEGQLGHKDWSFSRRHGQKTESIPDNIKMTFRPWKESIELAKERNVPSVISGFGEVLLDPDMTRELSSGNFRIVSTPNAWHMVIKLNSAVGAFSDLELRRAFIMKLRQEMAKRYPEGVGLEESIFTRLLEGYVEYSKTEINVGEPNLNVINKFQSAFPKGLVWVGKEMYLPAVDDAIGTVCRSFGIKCQKLSRASARNQNYDLFVGLTGFWSYDPYGDIKMLFTPNLHKELQDVASDSKLQKMLSNLNLLDFPNKASAARELDRYIHEKYIYNVVAHFPFVFLYSKSESTGKGIPQSGTLPYPWMLSR
jgi:hypothetical protein